jgi:hypothetical protein
MRNTRPRHAAPSRATRLAGTVALGTVAAPAALLAVTGTASAAGVLDLEDDSSSLEVEGTSSTASGDLADRGLPAGDETEAPALPAPDGLPDPAASGDAPALPGADDVPALPGAEDLPALPDAEDLPALPGTEDLPALPGAGDLPALPAGELPLQVQLDWRVGSEGSTAELPSVDDVFSATDLLGGLV